AAPQPDSLTTEARARAQRDRWGELECRRRAKPGPARKVGLERALDPDRAPPECCELLCNGGGVAGRDSRPPGPIGGKLNALILRRERDGARRLDRHTNAEIDRNRQDEPTAVVGVLSDQVHAPRRPEASRHPPSSS